MSFIDAELIDRWRSKAEDLRRYGAAEASAALERCAIELEEYVREKELEELTIEQAIEESGYSRSSFERWLAEGDIPNAGEEGSPRVRRCDLPRKPGGGSEPSTEGEDGLPDVMEILEGETAGV